MTKSCAACGARAETDDAYCPECGRALGGYASWPAPPADPSLVPLAADGTSHPTTLPRGDALTVAEAKVSSWWYAVRLRWWRFLWRLSLRRHF
jgi:hypothetical protein